MAITTTARRRLDPERRDRIIDATLDVVARHGVAGTTHRRVAAAADVPLGSMTYHFEGMDELLTLAFTRLAEAMSARYHALLGAAASQRAACEAVTDIIVGDTLPLARDHVIVLSLELYAFAHRNPALQPVMQHWMEGSRAALRRHFDATTARALDALIEGLTLHNSLDRKPLKRAAVRRIVEAVAAGQVAPAKKPPHRTA